MNWYRIGHLLLIATLFLALFGLATGWPLPLLIALIPGIALGTYRAWFHLKKDAAPHLLSAKDTPLYESSGILFNINFPFDYLSSHYTFKVDYENCFSSEANLTFELQEKRKTFRKGKPPFETITIAIGAGEVGTYTQSISIPADPKKPEKERQILVFADAAYPQGRGSRIRTVRGTPFPKRHYGILSRTFRAITYFSPWWTGGFFRVNDLYFELIPSQLDETAPPPRKDVRWTIQQLAGRV